MVQELSRYLVNPGPKTPIARLRTAVTTDNAIATEVAMRVLAAGGNAVDAGIAVAMVQAAVEPYMTNHAGLISLLYYEAKTGIIHQLDGQGAHPSGLKPFRPIPPGYGYYNSAIIPGFMPALKALYERFGMLAWEELCEDSIAWAESGHPVSSFEYRMNLSNLPFLSYFAASRDYYLPGGYLPNVGELFVPKGLADTLRGVRDEGPGYMITGPWARDFVARANTMGWPITLAHMTETPPRWIAPARFSHAGREIVTLGAPQAHGCISAVTMGILRHLGLGEMTPGSADHLWAMGQALRQGGRHYEFIQDDTIYDVPADELMDDQYHAHLARMIERTRPKVDLSEHIHLSDDMPGGASALFGGQPLSGRLCPTDIANPAPVGSCEIAIVDAEGNWLQMMNTLQGSGIPGQVVGGVPMIGSHATFGHLQSAFDSTLIKGAKLRCVIGNTLVLDGGKPVISVGTPGIPHVTVPQVLAYLLDFKLDPYVAIDALRMYPMSEARGIVVEDRLGDGVVNDLHRLGIRVGVVPGYDYRLGSFSVIARDPATGCLTAYADPRRCGVADGTR